MPIHNKFSVYFYILFFLHINLHEAWNLPRVSSIECYWFSLVIFVRVHQVCSFFLLTCFAVDWLRATNNSSRIDWIKSHFFVTSLLTFLNGKSFSNSVTVSLIGSSINRLLIVCHTRRLLQTLRSCNCATFIFQIKIDESPQVHVEYWPTVVSSSLLIARTSEWYNVAWIKFEILNKLRDSFERRDSTSCEARKRM